ncbi:Histone deacetylase HDT1 [Zea mays]|uniref:Histone deacetylase HDT1 n=1 Tax=Zea mays TaxID=4577 RepID=A0A1D6N3W9_MAIZE|nr:Histone deacetylase HDT1 [Zea mays]
MEVGGQEVKPGATVSCKVGDGLVIHLSQAALGESKKASENAILSVNIDDKKLVLGTLSVEKHPQISCDLVFDKDFELPHNSKTQISAAKVPAKDDDDDVFIILAMMMMIYSSDDDDDDFTTSDSDNEMSEEDDSSDEDEMSEEDDSSDEDEMSGGADPSDDSSDESGSEHTSAPKKTDVVVGKKRAIKAEAPYGKKAKSEQSSQKTGDKASTSHPAKQSIKTPADKSRKTPTADKKSPKSGSHGCK